MATVGFEHRCPKCGSFSEAEERSGCWFAFSCRLCGHHIDSDGDNYRHGLAVIRGGDGMWSRSFSFYTSIASGMRKASISRRITHQTLAFAKRRKAHKKDVLSMDFIERQMGGKWKFTRLAFGKPPAICVLSKRSAQRATCTIGQCRRGSESLKNKLSENANQLPSKLSKRLVLRQRSVATQDAGFNLGKWGSDGIPF